MRIIFILLSLIAYGCRTAATDAQLAIAGGRLVGANEEIAMHTVALISLNQQPQSFCSGVIIARDMVLTAAHCLADKPKKFGLYFGTNLPDSAVDPNIQIVRTYLVHPEYSAAKTKVYIDAFANFGSAQSIVPHPKEALNDIALIRVPRELPDSFSPVVIDRDVDSMPKSQLTTAGFGCRDEGCTKEPDRLRKVTMTVDEVLAKTSHVVLRGKAGSGACNGDSGGPDFSKDQLELKLVGLVGVGPADCGFGVSVDTLVYPFQKWIDQTIEKLRAAD